MLLLWHVLLDLCAFLSKVVVVFFSCAHFLTYGLALLCIGWLLVMTHRGRYVVEEDQRGLQRAKWIELQAKKAKEVAKAEAKEAKEEEKMKKAAAKRA